MKNRLERYSMQMKMLNSLLACKEISQKEYEDIKAALMFDYKIIADFSA